MYSNSKRTPLNLRFKLHLYTHVGSDVDVDGVDSEFASKSSKHVNFPPLSLFYSIYPTNGIVTRNHVRFKFHCIVANYQQFSSTWIYLAYASECESEFFFFFGEFFRCLSPVAHSIKYTPNVGNRDPIRELYRMNMKEFRVFIWNNRSCIRIIYADGKSTLSALQP